MMTRETPTELTTVAAQAAEWIDRLREADAQDLEEFRDWLRPPEHLEEFLCAVAIDFAIHTLADVDSLRGTDSAGPGDNRLPAHVLTQIRTCALAITGDDCAVGDVVSLVLQRLGRMAGDPRVDRIEREAISFARVAARAWLREREALARSSVEHTRALTGAADQTLEQWGQRLSPLGTRRAEMFVRTTCLGQSVRQIAAGMDINSSAVKKELSQMYLHFMNALEEN
jgi:hypothetical protein